jgi:hypothetical protein
MEALALHLVCRKGDNLCSQTSSPWVDSGKRALKIESDEGGRRRRSGT